MARRTSSILTGLVIVAALAAAAWVTSPAFVAPPAAASRASTGGPVVVAAAGVLPLLVAQPAFAEQPTYPGLPYVIVFLGIFSAVFIIPNVLFPGK